MVDVQKMNRSLVIRLIRQLQVCSRTELAKATGLTQPTITNIVNDLIDFGLVKEIGSLEGERGRRFIGITMAPHACKVIGLRLTRSYVSAGLFDLDGTQYVRMNEEIETKNGVNGAMDTDTDPILIGASALAIDHVLQSPLSFLKSVK